MTTIPASQIVRVNPNVLNAGGNGLVLNGLMLTQNSRVPIGTILELPNDGVSVSNYFGPSATEVEIANVYFNGFNGSSQKPANIYFAQYNSTGVAAFLRGGPVNQLTIPQLQGISGSLTIVVDGYTYTAASINLSSATSYSAAATLIQTAINTSLPAAASFTGSIAAGTASVTASIAGNVMYVTNVASGTLVAGAVISGTGVTAGTQISSQLSGTTGGIGTYAVTKTQVVASETITAAYGTLTATAVASGTLSIGQTVSGGTTAVGTIITALGTGTGLTGTYIVNLTQTVTSGSLTTTGTALAVSFDSVSGGFIIASGASGAQSTVAFPTGTIAAPIFLTQATGAILSQGAAAATPSAFMTQATQINQNWATFMTIFDPDDGSGSVQKQAFASWNNSQNKRWAYVAWDTDITPTESNNTTSSFGNIIQAADFDGTFAIYQPASAASTPAEIAAFVCGIAASIDFTATNGRADFAFRGQDGLVAGVTDATSYNNLIANGYNCYAAFATANQKFTELQPGGVSGVFQWMDSYVNQIWLNNALQLALMELLQNALSVPYNDQGYGLIRAACFDPINAALNFGAIKAGVPLSSQQAALINNAAGTTSSNGKASDALFQQGWYLQIVAASPQVRQARTSPPCNFWYMDGQSVQQIVLNSTLVQ
ncbi:DUF3383 family protein [Rhizobium rhizogenes]|uniref:DUF3383 family protein n=1 Tax=Rhizobium rhizogenes TaxID=359 RepID=UPI00226D6DD9|nr:DUF3383 family protein [Rhizobium rhizogenes]